MSPKTLKEKFSISISSDVSQEIKCRGDERSAVIDLSLTRYYSAMRMERSALLNKFGCPSLDFPPVLLLLVYLLKGKSFTDEFSPRVVDKVIKETLDERTEFERRDSVYDSVFDSEFHTEVFGGDNYARFDEALASLTPMQKIALIDLAEEFWYHAEMGDFYPSNYADAILMLCTTALGGERIKFKVSDAYKD